MNRRPTRSRDISVPTRSRDISVPIRSGDISVPTHPRHRTFPLLLLAILPLAQAATLSIEPTGPETLNLHLAQDPASYFYLQQSTDLGHFTPFSMVLGETANDWNLYFDPETPSRFFRSRAISLFAPEDTDGDGLDDLYELRHPVLNPLDPTDGALDPDNNSLTFLDEYRLQYNLGDGKREAISDEVSTFTIRPFTGPPVEALSEEVSIEKTTPSP